MSTVKRRRMKAATLAVAWLMFGAPALAQPTPENPADIPRSIAASMIESADANGVFEYVHDGFITLRHVQSGLVCRFLHDGRRLLIFPGLARGEDVGCDQTDGHETVTLYATRYPESPALGTLMADARAAVEQRFHDARPYAPEAAADVFPDGWTPPESEHARYLLTNPAGERLYSRISVALVDGWSLKLRYSVLAPDEASLLRAEIEASAHWSGALHEFMINRAS